MRLVAKVFAVLAAVIVLSVALNYAVLNATVLPAFVQLEEDNARQNLQRVIDAIEGDVRHLQFTAQDWAFWDDTYDFVRDQPVGYREDYIDDNLYVETLVALNLNAMMILEGSGNVLWGMVLDLESEEEMTVDGMPRDAFPADSPLLDHPEPDGVVSGIYPTGHAPLLTASAPILKSDQTGPAVGTLIIGRFLDGAAVAELHDQTHVAFDLQPIENGFGTSAPEVTDGAGTDAGYWTVDEGDKTSTYGVLRDIAGVPVMVLRAETPREIVAVGVKSTRIALASLLVVGLVVIVVIGLLLQTVVLSPIIGLTEHVLSIKRTGDLSRRLQIRRKDEIGILSAEFDGMIDQLSQARQELLDQSYKAGIAEMASGVLHNLRNQLSPLTMRTGRLRKLLGARTEGNVGRALDELAADETLSERSAKLARYLKLSASRATRDGEEALEEMDAVVRQLARVEDVLGEQDRFSRAKRVNEPVRLSDIVARAISLMPEAENSGIEVTVDPGVDPVMPFRADRFVLTQIVNNLLINSAEAIRVGGADAGRIDIAASVCRSADGGQEVTLEVRDNGIGIGEDIMDRIFERGFTTKGGGKGGFGLHWCANTIGTLNGRIYAESRGKGRGASMHVVVPLTAALDSAA